MRRCGRESPLPNVYTPTVHEAVHVLWARYIYKVTTPG